MLPYTRARRQGVEWRVTKEDYVLSQIETAVSYPAALGASMTMQPNQPSSEVLLEHILTSLDEDKAEDIVSIPLKGKSEMADYMVICSGRSTRQVSSIAEKLQDHLKQEFGRFCKVEGKGAGDWVLLDTGDVIVHVFRPEVREFYQLEKMWMNPGEAVASPI